MGQTIRVITVSGKAVLAVFSFMGKDKARKYLDSISKCTVQVDNVTPDHYAYALDHKYEVRARVLPVVKGVGCAIEVTEVRAIIDGDSRQTTFQGGFWTTKHFALLPFEVKFAASFRSPASASVRQAESATVLVTVPLPPPPSVVVSPSDGLMFYGELAQAPLPPQNVRVTNQSASTIHINSVEIADAPGVFAGASSFSIEPPSPNGVAVGILGSHDIGVRFDNSSQVRQALLRIGTTLGDFVIPLSGKILV